jgi:cell wall-associated NlpC family hydrolase
MSWRGSPYGAPAYLERRDLVGRAVLVGGVLATAAVLFALLVTCFGPARPPAAPDPATRPSSALAERGPTPRPDDRNGSPDGDPPGAGVSDANSPGAGSGGQGEGRSPASGWESGWASAVPSPRGGASDGAAGSDGWGGAWGSALPRAQPGPVACTVEITDLAQLHAAMVNSGPDEIVCVRGPRTRPAALAAVAFARSQLGEPYRWAGNGRADGGFDCSGLTSASYASVGIPIPRTAQAQFNAGPQVRAGQPIKAGDLVFFGSGPHGVGHVGLAISATKMINAPDVGQVVTIGPIQRRDYVGATRPVSRQPPPARDGIPDGAPDGIPDGIPDGRDASGGRDTSVLERSGTG